MFGKDMNNCLKEWKETHGKTIFEGSVAKELDELIKDSKKKAKDAVMMIDSKIQTFRMYQTFGFDIPSFARSSITYVSEYLTCHLRMSSFLMN